MVPLLLATSANPKPWKRHLAAAVERGDPPLLNLTARMTGQVSFANKGYLSATGTTIVIERAIGYVTWASLMLLRLTHDRVTLGENIFVKREWQNWKDDTRDPRRSFGDICDHCGQPPARKPDGELGELKRCSLHRGPILQQGLPAGGVGKVATQMMLGRTRTGAGL